MNEKDSKSRVEHWALMRHNAVSWIEQSLSQGNSLDRALGLASGLEWGGRRYSRRTLEGWLYEWRAQGFGALERQSRNDKGARPYAAWSKGKIERFFQTVQRDFEARLRLDPVQDLESLNARFGRWLESEYHRRTHSALAGQCPADLFAQKASALRQLDAQTDWRRLFLAHATRRVRLDATISLDGTLWEVPVHLRGRQVQLRYEPFDWSVLEIWYQENFAGTGRRCDKNHNAKTYNSTDYER